MGSQTKNNKKLNKDEKSKRKEKSQSSSSAAADGLMKLAVVVAIFSVLLFGVMSFATGDSKKIDQQQEDASSTSRVIPKYANPEGKPVEAEEGCEDRSNQCQSFASRGECEKTPGWMIINCPVTCGACHLRDAKVRCDRDKLEIAHTKALEPNTLQTLFDRIENELSSVYNVSVESRSPFIITIDDFLTHQEADSLIEAGGIKWERSTDTGTANKFGETGRVLTEKRTSSNAWCRESCLANPDVQRYLPLEKMLIFYFALILYVASELFKK